MDSIRAAHPCYPAAWPRSLLRILLEHPAASRMSPPTPNKSVEPLAGAVPSIQRQILKVAKPGLVAITVETCDARASFSTAVKRRGEEYPLQLRCLRQHQKFNLSTNLEILRSTTVFEARGNTEKEG
jgi:hypothetical protein